MGWLRIVRGSLAVLGLAVCVGGCTAQTVAVIPSGERGPDLADRIAAAGARPGSAAESRGQMPESPIPHANKEGTDLSATAPLEMTTGQAAGRIAATVNGEVIFYEEVLFASRGELVSVHNMPEPLRSQKIKEVMSSALTILIDREVVLQDAFSKLGANPQTTKFLDKLKKLARDDFDNNWLRKVRAATPEAKTDEEFRELLRRDGLSLEMIRRQMERNFMKMEYLRWRVSGAIDKIGHPQILEYYEQHPEDFKIEDAVSWQDLFVDASRYPTREAARNFAESVAQRARSGEDFKHLVEQFDNGDSQLRQGEGEGHRRGEVSPHEAEAVLFSLNDGDVALVEMSGGFHIVHMVKRDRAGQRPFDDKVQKQIRDRLRSDIFQREAKRFINDLKRQAIIVPYGTPQP
jgi:parvulin-like peptidyl-prolyl isomerase